MLFVLRDSMDEIAQDWLQWVPRKGLAALKFVETVLTWTLARSFASEA